jgi:hypothetical protein
MTPEVKAYHVGYVEGLNAADEIIGALWSDLFNKDMVNRGADEFFDRWRSRLRALKTPLPADPQ